MDKDVEPLRCHWNDGHIPAPLPLLGRAELAGMGITRGRCEIVNECQDSFSSKHGENLHFSIYLRPASMNRTGKHRNANFLQGRGIGFLF